MFSRVRRPTRCWVRIHNAPSGVGGFTSRMSTASLERAALSRPCCTMSSTFGKFAIRTDATRRVPRLFHSELAGFSDIPSGLLVYTHIPLRQDFTLAQFLEDSDEDPIDDQLHTHQHQHGAACQI